MKQQSGKFRVGQRVRNTKTGDIRTIKELRNAQDITTHNLDAARWVLVHVNEDVPESESALWGWSIEDLELIPVPDTRTPSRFWTPAATQPAVAPETAGADEVNYRGHSLKLKEMFDHQFKWHAYNASDERVAGGGDLEEVKGLVDMLLRTPATMSRALGGSAEAAGDGETTDEFLEVIRKHYGMRADKLILERDELMVANAALSARVEALERELVEARTAFEATQKREKAYASALDGLCDSVEPLLVNHAVFFNYHWPYGRKVELPSERDSMEIRTLAIERFREALDTMTEQTRQKVKDYDRAAAREGHLATQERNTQLERENAALSARVEALREKLEQTEIDLSLQDARVNSGIELTERLQDTIDELRAALKETQRFMDANRNDLNQFLDYLEGRVAVDEYLEWEEKLYWIIADALTAAARTGDSERSE